MIFPPALETLVISLVLALAGYYGIDDPREGFLALAIGGFVGAAIGLAWLFLGPHEVAKVFDMGLGAQR
ncbi:hypothetical protein [Methyloceanibacter caenitepidi]|uniref:Uncharacterized protein n=1 Tax=Methyloceanibacter caenitepidi TaxID=1384459 RepID=A0A0A8K2G2_9HYPH|nr:hypothetical protein [Methyloceanibacter caenitepidi]BAQ16946.1 hypothetical protein GL4_1490 [Methyloceanibacter caenitepidi]